MGTIVGNQYDLVFSLSNSLTAFAIMGSYYTKRSFVHDPRLSLLPKELFRRTRVLDVGCNEGWVTCEIGVSLAFKLPLNLNISLAQLWDAANVVGVDIDDTLIRAAWRRRRTLWSQQQPSLHDERQDSVALGSLEIMQRSLTHFPTAFEHMFGSLPIPPAANPSQCPFPHNLTFRTTNWIKDGAPEDKDGYDIVIAYAYASCSVQPKILLITKLF